MAVVVVAIAAVAIGIVFIWWKVFPEDFRDPSYAEQHITKKYAPLTIDDIGMPEDYFAWRAAEDFAKENPAPADK